MLHTPSNSPSSSESKRFGKTSMFVQRGIFATSAAALALLYAFDREDHPLAQPAMAKAVSPDDRDQAPVSALSPENVVSDVDEDTMTVQTVSFASTKPEQTTEMKKQPLNIEQLPEGVNLLDTPIMIRSGNDKFVLTVKDGGATLEVQELGSDKPAKLYQQKALGRGTILGFKKEMGPYDVHWPDVQVVMGDEKDDNGKVVRKDVKLFSIRGQQKGEKIQSPKEKPESNLADLCLNLARNGVISYKVDPVLGFEVTVTASEKKE